MNESPATTPTAPAPADRDAWRTRWPPMSYWARVALTIAAVAAVLLALWSVIKS